MREVTVRGGEEQIRPSQDAPGAKRDNRQSITSFAIRAITFYRFSRFLSMSRPSHRAAEVVHVDMVGADGPVSLCLLPMVAHGDAKELRWRVDGLFEPDERVLARVLACQVDGAQRGHVEVLRQRA